MTRGKQRGNKRGESKLASNQFPMCSPQSHRTHSLHRTAQRCSRSYTEKRRVRKETEVTRRRKGGIKKRETNPASNQFPKCSPQPGTHKDS